MMESFDEQRDKKACYKRSYKPAPKPLPWDKVITGSKQSWAERTTAEAEDVPGLNVLEFSNNRFNSAADCKNEQLTKKSSRFENVFWEEQHWMTRKMAVEVKGRTFTEKDTMSVLALFRKIIDGFWCIRNL